MERVTDERIADILDGLIYNKHSVIAALKELQARRKAEKEHGYTSHGTNGKEGAEAMQESEQAIKIFWEKLGQVVALRPCIECPLGYIDDCTNHTLPCGEMLRRKYESIAGAPNERKGR